MESVAVEKEGSNDNFKKKKMAGSLFSQLKILLWKNWLLKLRNPKSTLSEVVLPLAFVWLVVWLQHFDPDKDIKEEAFTCPRRSSLSKTLLFPKENYDVSEFIIEIDTTGFGAGIMTVPPFIYLPMIASKTHFVYALVAGEDGNGEMAAWLSQLESTFDSWTAHFDDKGWRRLSNITNKYFGFGFCRFKDLVKVFNSTEELESYIRSDEYGTSAWPKGAYCPDAAYMEKPRLHMALVLNSIGSSGRGEWDYTIRTNISSVPPTYPQFGETNTFVSGVNEIYQNMYMMGGFLTMQLAVDRAIVNRTTFDKAHTRKLAIRQMCDSVAPLIANIKQLFPPDVRPELLGAAEEGDWTKLNCTKLLGAGSAMFGLDLSPLTTPASFVPNDVRMAQFPIPEYTDRPFYLKIKNVFALDLILTFLWPISRLIRGVVHEKETRIREGMRMMGLRYISLYLSWLITYGVMFTTIAFCITALTADSLFARSDNSIVFMYFCFFGTSIVAYCILISVLFNRAKTASTAGVVMFFMGFFAYFAVGTDNATAEAKALSCLLSPTGFGLGAAILATYEAAGVGVTWGNVWSIPNESSISFMFVLLSLVFDTGLYMFLAFYLDQVLPKEFGVRKPWNFLFTRRFWLGKRQGRQQQQQEEEALEYDGMHECPTPDLRQLARDKKSVRVTNLRKTFKDGDSEYTAVKGLNVELFEGQIFALLGPNGAGKSTTISMLTGLLEPSSGTATVYGNDVSDEMDTVRESLGVCPQHDVLWPELTVREHLVFFANLKQVADVDAEVEKLIKAVGLTEKRDMPTSSLSGGQKRKVSVAIALIGDSKLVFLDEPTTGMDVYSRRSTWNLLRECRAGRIIVLTTHFMDEADMLGDRIGILAHGNLVCSGSSMFLKSKYGVGYTLSFALKHSGEGGAKQDQEREALIDEVRKHIPQASVFSSVGTEVALKTPFSDSAHFPEMFRSMDAQFASLNLATYGISVTTLEEVFLKVAFDDHESFSHDQRVSYGEEVNEGQEANGDYNQLSGDPEEQCKEIEASQRVTISERAKFWIQFRALFKKRLQYARRDRKSLCCNTLVPILLLVLGLTLLKAFPAKDAPALELTIGQFEQAVNFVPFNASQTVENTDFFHPKQIDGPVQPVDAQISRDYVNNSCALDPIESDIWDGNNLHALSDWVLHHRTDNGTTIYGAVQFSRVEWDRGIEYTILANSSSKHGPGLFLNLVNDALAREAGLTTSLIRVSNHPFPFTANFMNIFNSLSSIDASMSIVIAFSFVPASVAIFTVKEREISAKHQQLISGTTVLAYWTATYVWDVLMFMVPWSFSTLAVWAFDIAAFKGENLFAVSTLFLLYGIAIMPFTYLISFCFHSHSTAQNVVLLLNFITGLILLIVSVVMSAIESTMHVNHTLGYFYRLFPGFCLGNGLLGLTFYKLTEDIDIFEPMNSSPFSMNVIGTELIYLASSALVYLLLTIVLDLMLQHPALRASLEATVKSFVTSVYRLWSCFTALCCRCCRKKKRVRSLSDEILQPLTSDATPPTDDPEGIHDEDVAAERTRVDQLLQNDAVAAKSDYAVIVSHLRKEFDQKVAVSGLSVAIPPGECFGLLGVNGGGKTTTMKCLTGDLLATSGTAFLVGYDVLREQSKLRRKLGYCPQFDATLENLTVQEHLELYARIKCIPEHLVSRAVQDKIDQLNLNEVRNKIAGALSGGNRRRLSCAIALVGAPKVVFLDEPTSGLDPQNARFLQDVIASIVAQGTTCVLTSHSMTECETLCSRLGIMVSGQFAAFGSLHDLKKRFGRGLIINVTLGHPSRSSVQELQRQLSSHGIDVGDRIPVQNVSKVCSLLGKPDRKNSITHDHHTGSVVRSTLDRFWEIDAEFFIEWWVGEDYFEHLAAFFEDKFPRVNCLESRGHHTRWRVESHIGDQPPALAQVFQEIEAAKEALSIAEYSVSMTTLEQIFVMFASKQKEETTAVQGLLST